MYIYIVYIHSIIPQYKSKKTPKLPKFQSDQVDLFVKKQRNLKKKKTCLPYLPYPKLHRALATRVARVRPALEPPKNP